MLKNLRKLHSAAVGTAHAGVQVGLGAVVADSDGVCPVAFFVYLLETLNGVVQCLVAEQFQH